MSKSKKVLLGIAISLACASGANAAEFTIKNECSASGKSITALVYDEKDIVVAVPIASVRNLPKGRTLPLDGLVSGSEYKIHFTGNCEAKAKLKLFATNMAVELGNFTCPNSGTMDYWVHNKKPGMHIECGS
tara:strand:+ start:497 stop:892 length:396 start_codon:yes stop_codon:yes gene_type:complete